MTSLLETRSVIEITGNDRLSFIQNLVTNDIDSKEQYQYAMMLSPGGRFLFDLFILKESDRLILDISQSTQSLLMDKLELYTINQDVEITEVKAKVYYSRQRLNNSYKDPRHKDLGYRLLTNDNILEDDNSYIEDKYRYSIPDGGIDLLFDKAMPQEYGAEEMGAISYSKGCYVGQEVISRTKHQGQVRKKIYSIKAEADLSSFKHSTPIMQNENKVGIFLSGYMGEGIALIREINFNGLEASIDNMPITLKQAIWYS